MSDPELARGFPSPVEWYERAADGRVRCELCPRGCTMLDGQRGFCFVRGAHDGRVVLTSYGRASGFCVDPIEKKPLNHFLPGTAVLSFGTAGCNLGCRFCQNHDISKARQMDALADRASPEAVAQGALDAGCRSVAFTYNDPVVFAEYAIDCAEACREAGVHAVAVTAGYITERARDAFFRPLSAVNVDLKAFTEGFYEKLTFASLAPVLETLTWLARETDVWLEVTTLLIPGHNDSAEEVGRLVEWFADALGADVPLHFSAFHPDFRMRDVPRTPPATLARARRQALAAGLRHVYTGNVHDRAGQSTYCAGCGEMVIGRDWYALDVWRLDDGGRCEGCGAALRGRFEGGRGRWGRQRRRVRLS